MNPLHAWLCLVTILPTASSSLQERVTASQPAQALAAERRELAEIRLLLAAERDHAGAETRLAALHAALAARTEAEARDLLAEVERVQAEVLRPLGPAPAGDGDLVERAVADALLRNDFGFLAQLGSLSAPAVASAVRGQPDAFPTDPAQDPLDLLARLDFRSADGLVLELLEHPGFLWRKRVARLLWRLEVENERRWSREEPPRWLGEGFARFALRYAEDPDVGLNALGFLVRLVQRGWRAPAFDAVLERALRSSDPARRDVAIGCVRSSAQAYGQARLEALLAEPDPRLREFAAQVLAYQFPAATALLALAGDPEPGVRVAVARHMQGALADGPLDPEREQVLVRLLLDPHGEVAESAWRAFAEMPLVPRLVEPPAAELFDPSQPVQGSYQVLRDPPTEGALRQLLEAETRPYYRSALVLRLTRLVPPLNWELLLVLAADREPAVLDAVSRSLGGFMSLEEPEAALRVAGALLDNPAFTGAERVTDTALRMTETRRCTTALLRWLLARDDEALLRRTLPDGLSSNPFPLDRLLQVDPTLVVAWLTRVHSLSTAKVRYVCSNDWGPPELGRALLALARDEASSPGLRVLALQGAFVRGEAEAEITACALALVAAPGWRDPRVLAEGRADFQNLVGKLDGTAGNAVILRALEDPELPEALAISFGGQLDGAAPGAHEIVALVLQRGFEREEWQAPVGAALEAFGDHLELEGTEVLAAAARVPWLSSRALWAIGNRRDPRHLPLLAELVARPGEPSQRDKAAQALFGYLDAEAVEPLLVAAASVTDPELRDRCLAQLEKIREYQDAKERWATRKARVQTREQVIAELVTQLDAKSDEVKVQAIRALATWEAVEVMPRLIELSAAGSKSVAAAARAALDRLNERPDD